MEENQLFDMILKHVITDTSNNKKEDPKKLHNLNYYERYSPEELAKLNHNFKSVFNVINEDLSEEEVLVSTDDEIRSKTWGKLLKSAAYYFENPNNDDRYKMLGYINKNYDGLLRQTKSPDEVPDLRSNKHLVNWVCKKYNEFLEEKGNSHALECNTNNLLKLYGPNTKAIKNFLGGSEFFH